MSKKSTYDDALSALTDVLSKREKELDARDKKLRKAERNALKLIEPLFTVIQVRWMSFILISEAPKLLFYGEL
jgi:hypothetical protein